MFVVFDKTLSLYRKGADWTSDKAEADQFASAEIANRLARTLAAGFGREVVVLPAGGA